MFKSYHILFVGLVGLCSLTTLEAVNVRSAANELKTFIASKPLTADDKASLQRIIDLRMKGLMVKIAPTLSKNGNAAIAEITAQGEKFGGFATEEGQKLGAEVLQLLQ